jgi:hypothetical protein
VWLALELSPETKETMEEIQHKMRIWWASDTLMDPEGEQETEGRVLALVDPSASRRYRGIRRVAIPPDAKPYNANDFDCYEQNGRIFCA